MGDRKFVHVSRKDSAATIILILCSFVCDLALEVWRVYMNNACAN